MTRISRKHSQQIFLSGQLKNYRVLMMAGCFVLLAALMSLGILSTGDHILPLSETRLLIENAASSDSTIQPEKIFQKTSGNHWKMWYDSEDPLVISENHIKNETYKWTKFKAYYDPRIYENAETKMPSPQTVSMCIHETTSDRWVSKSILSSGRWQDCNSLSAWYYNSNHTTDGWYVDIGANIGSCVLQVLLTTNAKIIAFEPDPRNLFCLTSTISQLPREMRKRVYVFPVALGANQGTSEIHVAADNRGNAVVGQQIIDHGYKQQRFLEPLPISIEVIDDLLDVSEAQINLVKLDAQGYECNIVQGMTQFLKKAKIVMFELEKAMLRSFPECSEEVLWNAFQGFDKYLNNKVYIDHSQKHAAITNIPTVDAINLVARKRDEKVMQ